MGRPRKDFAVLHYRAFTDERYDRLGAALVKLKLALPITASDTARSLSTRLWVYLLRLNDRRGVLPGNGIQAARAAFGLGPAESTSILAGMARAGLLEKTTEGLRVRGFEETYEPLYRERDRDRHRKSDGVSRGNSHGTTAPTVAVAVAVPEDTATTEAEDPPPPPLPGGGGEPKKKRDLRTPVERILGEKGIHLSSRGGCGINAWRKQLRAATAAGAPDQEVADAIEASSPLDKPWDALQPITNRYGRASRRDSRGFRIPAGAPKLPPGESFGEGKRARNDEGPMEDL